MTRWKHRAYKIRHLLLVLAVICLLTTMVLSCTLVVAAPLEPFFSVFTILIELLEQYANLKIEDNVSFIIFLSFCWGLFFFSMWLYLRPRKNWIKAMATPARPMKRAVLVAAFIATMLCLGVFWLTVEILNIRNLDPVMIRTGIIYYGSFLLVWLIWSWLFYKYFKRGDHYTQLNKMTRALLAGSSLESIIATIVFSLNPHNEDCYCFRGSYLSLVISIAVILWCFGPGLIFLYYHEKHRQAALLAPQYCPNCHYNLYGISSSTCPECGYAITKNKPE